MSGNASLWMHVDAFTVNQAAALWCNVDPAQMASIAFTPPSEVEAVRQMLTAAIMQGALPADTSVSAFKIIGDYSKAVVTRQDLEAFARNKGLYPPFLFDTLAPFTETGGSQTGPLPTASSIDTGLRAAPIPDPIAKGKGGRPQEYDWDSFTSEIVRRANSPDGLPERQADLIRDMLQWFRDTFDMEPAESSVKARISKIYRYLGEAKNPSP
tara:strand:+ start:4384 stop:5019 length:636 start_codon:yes stop_codon:yes gene_type:complete